MALNAPRRDEPQAFQMYGLDRAPLDAPGPVGGLSGAPISGDPATGALTLLVELPAGWTAEGGGTADLELFVLQGTAALEGTAVGCGGYVHVPQGASGAQVSSPDGALALAYVRPDAPSFPAPYTAPRSARSWEIPWQPVFPGMHGILFKPLRQPDLVTETFDGGPGGFLRIFLIAPGIGDPEEHVHHECFEEVITLAGDVLMTHEGMTGRGSVLGHPPGFWHGPFASHQGAVLLVHSDAPMGAPWPKREMAAGPAICEHWLDGASWVREAEHEPWATRPEAALTDGSP
jgi:hypothetical protein